MKTCSKCGHNKEPTEFYKKSENKDGLCYECKDCNNKAKNLNRNLNMNKAKFNSMFNGLSSQLKKVYEATPISEPWVEQKIHAEIIRSGTSIGGVSIVGMLNKLKELGLINEPMPGLFIRESITEKVKSKFENEKIEFQLKIEEPMTKSPMQQLQELSSQAIQLANLCKKLSSDIETAAINIDDHIAKAAKDSVKLKQLQDLLKG